MALLKRSASALNARPPSHDALVALMRTGHTQAERRGAVKDLASDVDADRDLAAALHDEPDPGVRAAILAALVSIGTERVADGLADALSAEDPALRNAAIQALRHLGSLALPHAERLLATPHPEQRIVAIMLLETLDDQRARPLLHAALEHDPEVNVGLAAVEVLSLIGGPEDQTPLRRFAARFPDDPFAAFAVELACRRTASCPPE